MRPICCVLAFVSLLAGDVRLPAATAQERPSRNDTNKDLVGAWRLVSWEQRLADGTTRPSSRTVGSLIYSNGGRMCAVIMDPNRPAWRGRPAEDRELRAAYDGLVSYCGRYEVNATEGFVVHHVDIDKTPASVGSTRKRWLTFQGRDRLVLRVDRAELQVAVADSTLVWARVRE